MDFISAFLCLTITSTIASALHLRLAWDGAVGSTVGSQEGSYRDRAWHGMVPWRLSKVKAGCASTAGAARMCHASTANPGTSVTIDTSGARATDNTTLAPLCVCRATIRNAKLFSVKITGPTGVCGSFVKIHSNDTITPIDIQSGETCSSTVRAHESAQDVRNLILDLEIWKIHKPFDVDYCIELSIPQCKTDEFQCLDGTCIHSSKVCDYDPNCPINYDDEDNCVELMCVEDLTPCNDQSRCYSKDDTCNNHLDCDDGSDEYNCANSTILAGRVSTEAETTPTVIVECDESQYFSTTTTSTTVSTTMIMHTASDTTTAVSNISTQTSQTAKSSVSSELSDTASTQSAPPPAQAITLTTNASVTNVTSSGSGLAVVGEATADSNDDDKAESILSRPYVIAGLVVGSLALLGLTAGLIVAARRKRKQRKSQNMPQSDLWIPGKSDKDAEQMAPLQSDKS